MPSCWRDAPWGERLDPAAARGCARRRSGPAGGEEELAARTPTQPSQAVALARGHDPVELVLARALGAEWLDDYLGEWRRSRSRSTAPT